MYMYMRIVELAFMENRFLFQSIPQQLRCEHAGFIKISLDLN